MQGPPPSHPARIESRVGVADASLEAHGRAHQIGEMTMMERLMLAETPGLHVYDDGFCTVCGFDERSLSTLTDGNDSDTESYHAPSPLVWREEPERQQIRARRRWPDQEKTRKRADTAFILVSLGASAAVWFITSGWWPEAAAAVVAATALWKWRRILISRLEEAELDELLDP